MDPDIAEDSHPKRKQKTTSAHKKPVEAVVFVELAVLIHSTRTQMQHNCLNQDEFL